MKRMKKLLAFLLAAMLLLTMIPISASAEEGNVTVIDNKYYDGVLPVYYNIYESQLLKLLYLHVGDADKASVSVDTKIEDVTLHLKEAVASSDERKVRYFANVSPNHMGGYYHTDQGMSNLYGNGNPGNIESLEIEYDKGTVTIPAEDLRARYVGSNQLQADYELEANDDSVHLVAFYYPASGTIESPVYNDFQAIRFVKDGDIVTDVPNGPSFTAGDYAFIGWDNLPTGGDPFLAYEPVTADKLVYARVATSSWSISRYRVRNTDNELLNRVLELYNASQSTEATIDDIELETVEIIVNGNNNESTDPDFTGSGLGWQDDYGYFVVGNGDVAGLNEHIPADEVTSITVSATIMQGNVGKQMSFQLDENSEPGGVSVSLGQEHFAWIIVNPKPEVPGTDDWDDPDDEGANDLYAQTGVVVDCTSNDNHDNGNYKLKNTNGTMKWSADEEAYVYEIEVEPDAYVDEYNTENTGTTHTLSPDNQSGTIVLVFKDGKWSAVDDKGTVTFKVTCEDEQGGEDPDKPDAPDKDDIAAALKDIIAVTCDQAGKHNNDASKYFSATKETATITEPTDGVKKDSEGIYTYTITVSLREDQRDAFIQLFDSTGKHTFKNYDPEDGKLEVTLNYVPSAQTGPDDSYTWALSESSDLLTIYVTCNDGGGDPDEPDQPDEPTAPTYDDLKALIDVKVECTNTQINPAHPNGNYELMQGTYDVVKASTGDTWTVTVRSGDYIVNYEKANGNVPHGLTNDTDTGSKTVSVVKEGDSWKLANGSAPTTITFKVKCGSTIIKVPGEGEDHWYPVYVDPEDPTDPDQTGVADLLETDDHIQYLFGYPDGSFGPNNNMTRAEAAQMFYNLLKDQDVEAASVFDDVPEGAWYATPVNVMAELGIVDGVGDDKFEPNREITRAEFTTMAMRFADVPSGGVNIFTDVAPDDWFYSYVVNSIQYGWIEGYGDGTFRPDRLITRAEVTTIVNRMLDRQADMAFVIQNRDKLTKFTDLTTEHWAYYTIVEATNEHNYQKPAIGEDWTSLK